ncbi:rho GTPase-activating protein 26 isoform X2 [Contarinia nasturtii]|nr:rho GTPase-activating protein 26 isoform X2 [Contarinia nasturtii]
MLEREYLRESLSYVLAIQDVQERIKFEFVETLLGFMSGWLVFYHLGHEIAEDAKEYMTDLQHKVQKTRENFDETRMKAEELKAKYMDSKMKPETEFTKQGYLFLMEKSKLKAFTATWSKFYCTYKKQQKLFSMLPYNQISGRTEQPPETLTLTTCTRRASDFEKRFCFDLTFEQKPGVTFTFQALSEEDRKVWLNAMDGKEPTYLAPGKSKSNEEYLLDDVGFAFARKCIEIMEVRGLEEEGLYRIGGVNTKITKLLTLGMDRNKTEKERLQFFHDEQHSDLLETKTIASALKHYLRNLNEPLMTYRYHNGFIAAAKQETRIQRISDVHTLVYRLPKVNFEMLEIIIRHLKAVSMKCHKNKMSVFNLGVVFGPTLLRAAEETLAAILDIKFNNVVIEILIENYDLIFKTSPGKASEYLSHAQTSPPEPVPRTYGGYRSNRNSINNTQPLMRVVTRVNYTDTGMSSSLQNIPNGANSIYQNSNNKIVKNHHPIYEAKPTHINQLNQSTPSLAGRDVNHIIAPTRELSIGRDNGSGLNYLTSSSPNSNHLSQSPIHRSGNSSLSSSIHHEQSISPLQSNHINNRDKLLNSSRENSTSLSRTPDSVYVQLQSQRLNALNYSENNLVNPVSSVIDRINSTSSSNESVCSTSSLNHSYTRQPPTSQQLKHLQTSGSGGGGQMQTVQATTLPSYMDYNSKSNNYDTSQSYMPKKTQRTKDIARQRYNSPRDNVRVRTLYACMAENDGELSFEPNQIITNVRQSNEPGWLDGTLNGKSGLIPENYVEVLK